MNDGIGIIAAGAVGISLPMWFVLGLYLNDSPAAQPAPVWRCTAYFDPMPAAIGQPATRESSTTFDLDHATRFAIADMRVTISDGRGYPPAARVECEA